MPKYWLVSDRNNGGTGQGLNTTRAGLTYWISDGGDLTQIGNWNSVSAAQFQTLLAGAADQFPANVPNEEQAHVTLLVHGFNVNFESATKFYQKVSDSRFTGPNSLQGLCVLYDWPSLGSVAGYWPDRATARACAADLTNILSTLYDWLLKKQTATITNPANACKAKVSMIAHSMGNYVLQKAMAAAWTRNNQPLLASLLNQLVMVAADVDNDLFDAGAPDNNDGQAIANLTYRISALYSGRDSVLGMSAGMKHFGKRRLGRSGLDRTTLEPDNVCDLDCSPLFAKNEKNIHSAYFWTPRTQQVLTAVLRGYDRQIIADKYGLPL